MSEIFTLQNLTLLIASLVNLLMSVLVLNRGLKNKINLYFSLLTFLAFMWALTQLLSFIFINNLIWLSFWDRSTYLFATAILVCLLYFIVHFPYKSKNLSIFEKILVWVPAVSFVAVIYTGFFISDFSILDKQQYRSHFYGHALILYMVYFIAISIISLYRLLKKYRIADSIFRPQIKWLGISFTMCLVFGFYIDLWLSYFDNYYFIWMGPLPTLLMNIVVFYFITSAKDKING